MPIYVYKCEDGHITEVNQSIKAPPLTKCGVMVVKNPTKTNIDTVEECQKPLKRVIQKTSFSIK